MEPRDFHEVQELVVGSGQVKVKWPGESEIPEAARRPTPKPADSENGAGLGVTAGARCWCAVLHEYGSSGDDFCFWPASELTLRAAVASRPDESWPFDQLSELQAVKRELNSDWSGGTSAHSRPFSEALS